MNVDSQCEAIARHLRAGKTLTALQALRKFGSMRLGARVWDLKQRGMAIEKTMVTRGEKKVACYRKA